MYLCKRKRGLLILKKVSSIIILILSVIIFMGCSIIRGNENKELYIPEKEEDIVTEYLCKTVGPEILSEGEEYYCAFKVLGVGEEELYIWALIENSSDSAASIPIALKIEKDNNQFKIISYEIPGNGSLYGEDIKKLFPKNVQDIILDNDVIKHNNMVKDLQLQIDKIKSNFHLEIER